MKLNLVSIPILIIAVAVLLNFSNFNEKTSLRVKLAALEVDLTGDGVKEEVLKVKLQKGTDSKIVLEVYRNKKLLEVVTLPEMIDAVFQFNGKRGNMFAADINRDGINDVITISRDKKLKSKLSILTYKEGKFTTDI